MRKLASIQEVTWKQPIPNKDRIELCGVLGWQLIAKKDEFQIGDKCVFIEPDAVLPDRPEFEFLKSKGFRIKTMKMAGCLSQGILFPLSILPIATYNIDDDVTDILNIKQYEATMDMAESANNSIKINSNRKYPGWLVRFKWFRQLILPKRQEKGFPDFISKTDETRIQNMPFILKNKQPFICTEKVDGTSGTFVLRKRKRLFRFLKPQYDYIVCSRNRKVGRQDGSVYWDVSEKYKVNEILKKIIGDDEWVCLQGECIAPNVQKNKYHVTAPDLYIFNLIYPSGRKSSLYAKEICEANGLKFVPILNTNYILPDTVNEVLDYAHGTSKLYHTMREGIVFRSLDGKQSFKAVDPLFLIKNDE